MSDTLRMASRWRPRRSSRQASRLDPGVWPAIVALRVELLLTATVYGVVSLRCAGDERGVIEWRAWVEWLHGLCGGDRRDLGDAAIGAFENPIGGSLNGWFDRVREWLDDLEDQDVNRCGDLMTEVSREDWLDALERLEERARAVEVLGGEPLAEEIGRDALVGVALLGAVEDSLALILFGGEDGDQLRSTAREICELLVAAKDAGLWGSLDAE